MPAAVAGFGAVSWGVASFRPAKLTDQIWSHPALIAAIGVCFVAASIIFKILYEHNKYRKTRKDEAKIAKKLAALTGDADIVPEYVTSGKVGKGAWVSAGVVAIAAIAAIAFCLAVFFSN